jgi:hypothetical protein
LVDTWGEVLGGNAFRGWETWDAAAGIAQVVPILIAGAAFMVDGALAIRRSPNSDGASVSPSRP